MPTPSKSADLYQRAKKVMPGGVSRNTILRHPHPPYAVTAAGCRVTDMDGIERIDFSNNMASLIHGHCFAPVVEAVTEQLQRGSAFTMATEVEVEFAEHLCSRNPAFEKVRFVNSGTEAVMGCLKAARAFTGRPKIAKVEGAYHGQYDYAEVSQTAGPGNWGDPAEPASVPVARAHPPRPWPKSSSCPSTIQKARLLCSNAIRPRLPACCSTSCPIGWDCGQRTRTLWPPCANGPRPTAPCSWQTR